MTAVRAMPFGNIVVHGSPNWVDLYTENAFAARSFYGSLLDWRFQNRFSLARVAGVDGSPAPIEEARATLLVLCNGRPAAEIIERDELFTDMLLPSRWYPHLTVVDLDGTLRRVQAAGGTVIRSPHQRGCMATVATILDPTGAMLCLWQPGDQNGNRLSYSAGALTWLELRTPDIELARWFYRTVFDWRATAQPPAVSTATVWEEYTAFSTAQGLVAGAVQSADDPTATWCPSFAVPDLAKAAGRAVELGAVAVGPAFDLPLGRQCSVVDPEGAEFSLLGPRRSVSLRDRRRRARQEIS
jgi:predicted enzyme related to lactoylglutathione lyase